MGVNIVAELKWDCSPLIVVIHATVSRIGIKAPNAQEFGANRTVNGSAIYIILASSVECDSPNFVAFINLLEGLQNASERWQRPVREIVHDKQAEVEEVFATWHATISRPELASTEGLLWPGESKPFMVQKVTGSTFRTATEEESAGLQVVDVVLWCFKRIFSGKDIGQETARLLNWVMHRAYQHDFSFEGVGRQIEAELGKIMDADMTEDQLAKGRELMADMEAQRQSLVTAHGIGKAEKLTAGWPHKGK